MSHEDKEKYEASLKPRKKRERKKRTTRLSDKTKDKAFKQFEEIEAGKSDETVSIDEHVKLNDTYMRTGPYQPKRK